MENKSSARASLIKIDQDLHAFLKMEALRKQVTMGNLVNEILREWFRVNQ